MVSALAWQQRAAASFLLAEEQRVDTLSQFLMRRSLTKTEIIRRQQDIDRIFKRGKKISCKGMRLLAIENEFSFDRFIVIPAKHYGNAVQRNLIRRRCKEIFRLYEGRRMLSNEVKDQTVKGRDIAVVVYPGKVLDFALLESELHSLLDRLD